MDEKREYATLKNYHVSGCSKNLSVKQNAVFFNANNTIKHELSKALGALMLLKYGDIKFTAPLVLLLTEIQEEVEQMKIIGEPQGFITEAVPNEENWRRVDLVALRDDTRFEFETNHKIKKDNAVTIYL